MQTDQQSPKECSLSQKDGHGEEEADAIGNLSQDIEARNKEQDKQSSRQQQSYIWSLRVVRLAFFFDTVNSMALRPNYTFMAAEGARPVSGEYQKERLAVSFLISLSRIPSHRLHPLGFPRQLTF